MKTIDSIPTSKIQRASKLIQTGAKVGVNYLKYYGDKITKTEEEAKESLNKNNAAGKFCVLAIVWAMPKMQLLSPAAQTT